MYHWQQELTMHSKVHYDQLMLKCNFVKCVKQERTNINMKLKFKQIVKSETLTGILLIFATIISLIIANSHLGQTYHHLFNEVELFGHFNIHMIVNDFFMAIFFLLVGLEIKHEILHGHLSSFKKAAFPIIAALGGVLVPAIIFTIFNHGTLFEHGIGVPISTDIAFAIGIFMMLKNKMNPSLKIFLLALAIVDDLISILVIGILYSSNINFEFLSLAAVIMFVLILMNKKIKVNKATPYMLIALVLWFCIYKSGIHATISGVLLALAIPTKVLKNEKESVSQKLEHKLNPLCNLFILPLFALVNTAISLSIDIDLASPNTLIVGIVLGLVIGKPLGIMLFTFIATKLGIIERPETATWGSIFSVSLLAGIGFTMAIFIAEIAFEATPEYISIAKISILGASILSIISTYIVATISSRVSIHNMKIANNTESESVA